MVGQHRITQCLARSADLCPVDLRSCYQPFVVLSETYLSSEGEIIHWCVPVVHRVPKCVAITCIYLSMYFRPNSVNFFFLNWSMTFWVWTMRIIKKSFQARFQSSFYNTVVYLLQSHNMVNKHSMQYVPYLYRYCIKIMMICNAWKL